jgi:hypothetical protein
LGGDAFFVTILYFLALKVQLAFFATCDVHRFVVTLAVSDECIAHRYATLAIETGQGATASCNADSLQMRVQNGSAGGGAVLLPSVSVSD